MVQFKYLPCYFFLIMCGMSHVFSIKKKYKQAFKTGLAHGMGGLTPSMLNIISNPSSIKSMGWAEIGHLLQGVLQNDYDLEDSLGDLQEMAEENRIAYLSGLPILAVFLGILYSTGMPLVTTFLVGVSWRLYSKIYSR